jgi:hypothetical protein
MLLVVYQEGDMAGTSPLTAISIVARNSQKNILLIKRTVSIITKKATKVQA